MKELEEVSRSKEFIMTSQKFIDKIHLQMSMYSMTLVPSIYFPLFSIVYDQVIKC